jgi:hypothetical protein
VLNQNVSFFPLHHAPLDVYVPDRPSYGPSFHLQ